VPRPPVEPQSNTLLLTEKLDIGQDKVNEVIDLIDEIDDAGPKTFLGARDGTMVTDLTASELGQLIETAMGRALSKIFKK
jgi:hypothetical protein